MPQEKWTAVDDYFDHLLLNSDPVLDEVLRLSNEAGLPSHSITPQQGQFLQILARMQNAQNILEIGTMGAYSTIWLARALPENGRLITLEAQQLHADVARKNIHLAGLENIVDLRFGPALETLPVLAAENLAPFDFIFIDADKINYPDYFRWALKLSRKGSVIICDNIVRDGDVIGYKDAPPHAYIQGVRRVLNLQSQKKGIVSAALQTVCSKGHDGFSITYVLEDPATISI